MLSINERPSTTTDIPHLPVLQPHFTTRHSTRLLLSLSVLFLFVSVIVHLTMKDVHEIVIDYTDCQRSENPQIYCEQFITIVEDGVCPCQINFFLHEDIRAPVNIYYSLTNFYQNHRNYVLSKDYKQLLGELSEEVADECKPYDRSDDVLAPRTIAPCGAIANSLFNDTILLFSEATSSNVQLIRKNLVWPHIKNRFRNPPGNLRIAFQNFSRPTSWRKDIWELDEEDPTNNGFENEDFIVWMQPATFSKFRKLYRRIDHSLPEYKNGLPKGNYTLHISYAFPVGAFNGRKRVIISNTSVFGGANTFMVYWCLVVSGCCIFAAALFAVVKYLQGKQNRNNYA